MYSLASQSVTAVGAMHTSTSGAIWLISGIYFRFAYRAVFHIMYTGGLQVPTPRPIMCLENGDSSPGLTINGHKVCIAFCSTVLAASMASISQ